MPEWLTSALRALGLLEEFLREVHHQDPRERPARLEEFREKAEKVYRRLALECHPDRGGVHARMAEINAAMDRLRILHIEVPPPAPQVSFVVVGRGVFGGFGGCADATTTSSVFGGGWWPPTSG